MSSEGEFQVPLRLNNTIFQCKIDGKFHNVLDVKAYAVQIVSGIVIDPATRRPAVALDSAIICETCYKDEQFHMKEPSPIVIPKIDEQALRSSLVGKDGKPTTTN